MFVVVSYDISSRRAGEKVRKACNRYLRHIQKSVYEGEITEKKLRSLVLFSSCSFARFVSQGGRLSPLPLPLPLPSLAKVFQVSAAALASLLFFANSHCSRLLAMELSFPLVDT